MMQSTQNWNFPDIFVTLNIIWDEIFLIHVVLMITELICFPCVVVYTSDMSNLSKFMAIAASISFHVSHLVKVYSITSLYSLFMCVETHKITLASPAPARFLPPVLANLVCWDFYFLFLYYKHYIILLYLLICVVECFEMTIDCFKKKNTH